MSNLESRILDALKKNNIDYEVQIPVPINEYPWKTIRSKTPPKSDIYLPKFDLYVEVKGFMTYQAVSKLAYLSKQKFHYYIFQGTEPQWDPSIETYLSKENQVSLTKKGILNSLIDFQVKELVNLDSAPDVFFNNISQISLKRLQNYISVKINEYKDWNEEWY